MFSSIRSPFRSFLKWKQNESLHFICKTVPLKVNPKTAFTSEYEADEIISLPVAHGEGNYFCDEETQNRAIAPHLK